MSEITVLLPTIRPQLVARAIASIGPAAAGISYEVIVITDGAIPPVCDQAVTLVYRERRGPIDAINAGLAVATGEYIFVFNDESTLDPEALAVLYREATNDPAVILTPRHLPTFNFSYYGRPFAAFPFVHRDVIDVLGGLFDPAFLAFYADPDFSMRAHAAGIPIRTVDNAVIRHDNRHDAGHAHNVNAYLAADRETFRMRWAHLGPLIEP
jgi:GT2 family glycosyltransferase